MCYFALRFEEWIECLHESPGNWLQMCSLYLTMAKDFLTFVDLYRCGDSIGIELGYQASAPVWKCLGQTRYLKRHWCQLETLLQKFSYSKLEEI